MMNYESISDLVSSGGVPTIRAGHPDDVFIVAASFEGRSTALTTALATDYRCKNAFVYVNRDLYSDATSEQSNRAERTLLNELAHKSESVQTIDGSWSVAAKQVRSLSS